MITSSDVTRVATEPTAISHASILPKIERSEIDNSDEYGKYVIILAMMPTSSLVKILSVSSGKIVKMMKMEA